ncbi:DUF2059 domain-containing protein [Psychrobacter sp. SCQQ22]|uniref:DUF2059 domain-containing protein n=1 Tax=Psychrobacter sp. SCQQ22 TaxID=2792059 RepID=UPI0018CD07DE|nr:DUF2059 domain-containing protein [Psychrobacter sp. SCQQ22]MBH0085504.1 DUF2059 domain-containing protein [Psychrobacter sp. SCQQ22]
MRTLFKRTLFKSAILKNTVFAVSLSISAVSLMAVPTLSVQAAVPTDASLLKLIKVTKVVEMMNDMSSDSGITDQVTQSMLSSLPVDNLSTDQRQRLEGIISKYSKEMTDNSDRDSVNQQVIKVYMETAKQHFDQAEVDAQIAFYSSKAGQSIIDKQPDMMKDYMAKVMPIVMESTMEKVQDIMPRMAADIKALKIEE